jgi:hypothetical protein
LSKRRARIPGARAKDIDATLPICSGIVFVSIAVPLLSREVRELPRLPPSQAAVYPPVSDGA